MYFILRGTVFVQVAETDKIAGLRMKQVFEVETSF